MDLEEAVRGIKGREEFVSFVRALQCSATEEPERWENTDLPGYLAALAAWVEDMDGYYAHSGRTVPEQPTWRILGEILLAARVYE